MQNATPSAIQNEELRDLLEFLHDKYNRPEFIADDPISIPHRFTSREDIEISGFLAATIAWGKRTMIVTNARRLMERMDGAPHDFIVNASEVELGALAGFVHRTFNDGDCLDFVHALRRFYTPDRAYPTTHCTCPHPAKVTATDTPAKDTRNETTAAVSLNTLSSMRENPGGLGGFFEREYASCRDMRIVLSRFREAFWQCGHRPRAEKHLASIDRGATCKRLNMFLRWMVRRDDRGVDFGLWNGIPASALYLPLDLHTGNTGRALGLLTRRQNDWRAVEEITAALRRFDGEDPVKYDFSLFGAGMYDAL